MAEEKSIEQLRAMAKLVWHRLLAGDDEEDIRASLDLDETEMRRVKDKMFTEIGEYVKERPIEHTYADYMLNQILVIKKLDAMVKTFLFKPVKADGKSKVNDKPHVSQPTAYVSALKAMSDIHDKILKTGKELGLVSASSEGSIVGGLHLSELTSEQLKSSIVRELHDLDRLATAYPSTDIMDQDIGDLHIHRQDSTKKQHARNPVHGGRGKVKTK